ncbi:MULTISPECIES: alpha/beta fold hydrolase [Leptolyngbya]|uniref:alpha/beta fold hydrolase n=1 Tax=Leptolyngbya TaxID=47251 RepID=UPI001AD060D3|nr:alpha/beta hydrolase [Leptolyngbya sp. UWPOB_LEPTO1]
MLTVAVVTTSSSTVNSAAPNRTSFGATWKTVDCKTFNVPASVAAQSDCGYVTENPEIPTLVLNGAYDPVTPQPYGEAVAKNLKTAYVYDFPGVGHGALVVPPSRRTSTKWALL